MLKKTVKLIIVIFILASFGYVVVKYTGVEEGLIKPETVYSFITGLISGRILNTYFDEKGE